MAGNFRACSIVMPRNRMWRFSISPPKTVIVLGNLDLCGDPTHGNAGDFGFEVGGDGEGEHVIMRQLLLNNRTAPIAKSSHPIMKETPPTGTEYTKNRRPVASQV